MPVYDEPTHNTTGIKNISSKDVAGSKYINEKKRNQLLEEKTNILLKIEQMVEALKNCPIKYLCYHHFTSQNQKYTLKLLNPV